MTLQTYLRRLFIIAAFVCAASFTLEVRAQQVLVNYDFATATASNCFATPAYTAPTITAEFGTNTNSCSTPKGTATITPPAYMANDNNQAISIQNSDITPSYFQFKLSGETLVSYANYRMHVQAQRSGNAPVTGVIHYSTDGINYTEFQSIPVGSEFSSFVFDLSMVPDLDQQSTVYFRIEARTDDRTSGNLRIDNFQISGELAPSAETGIISGRVISPLGKGLGKVTVSVIGTGIEEPMYFTTDSVGQFEFNDLPLGHTYVVMVSSARYVFDQSTFVVNLTDNFNEVCFIGEPRQ